VKRRTAPACIAWLGGCIPIEAPRRLATHYLRYSSRVIATGVVGLRLVRLLWAQLGVHLLHFNLQLLVVIRSRPLLPCQAHAPLVLLQLLPRQLLPLSDLQVHVLPDRDETLDHKQLCDNMTSPWIAKSSVKQWQKAYARSATDVRLVFGEATNQRRASPAFDTQTLA
jgi:hypothetical protein